MADVETKQRRLLWILTISLAVFLVLPGVILFSLHLRIEATLDTHRAEAAALLDDVPVRHSTRPAVLEPSEPGNVWDLLRPAFTTVANLCPLEPMSEYDELKDPNFDWQGIHGVNRDLMAGAEPALQQCRQALRRGTLDWNGPLDPDLPAKAGRIGRALCTRGALAWQAGDDAEALEWLMVALVVAQDTARLGQQGTWPMLLTVESWARQEARLRMAEHALETPELEEICRRLELVCSIRPPFALPVRLYSAGYRRMLLGDEPYVYLGGESEYLRNIVGGRDLYSLRLCRVRVLNGVKAGFDEIAAAANAPDPWRTVEQIRSRYPSEIAGLLNVYTRYGAERYARLDLNLFRLAVAASRVQAATGRYPTTVEEAGLKVDFAVPIIFEYNRISFQRDSGEVELVWTIGRRTKD